MPKVFVSYSHTDGDFAEVVRGRIKDAGFTTWIDLEGLQAGEDWRQEIDQAIRESVALITILTPASRESEYVAYEWAFALGAGVRIIPILLQPTNIHPRLAVLQRLDFTRREARPWSGLLDLLQETANAQPVHSIKLSRTAPQIVRDAAAALDNPDPQIMEEAMRRLSEMKLPEAEEALIEALNHPLPDVRIAAAWRLSERGDVRAVPGLIDGNRRRGWHNLFGDKIAEIGPSALPALRAALKNETARMREDLVWALGKVGGTDAVSEVAKVLGDPDPEVRVAALSTLRSLGTEEAKIAVDEAMPALVRNLQEGSRSVQYETAMQLEQVGTEKALAAVAEWKRKQDQPAPPTSSPSESESG
jgi:hypothetical protein